MLDLTLGNLHKLAAIARTAEGSRVRVANHDRHHLLVCWNAGSGGRASLERLMRRQDNELVPLPEHER